MADPSTGPPFRPIVDDVSIRDVDHSQAAAIELTSGKDSTGSDNAHQVVDRGDVVDGCVRIRGGNNSRRRIMLPRGCAAEMSRIGVRTRNPPTAMLLIDRA